MKNLSDRTWQIVQKMFPPDQHEEVGQLLTTECGNNLPGFHDADEEQLERIRFAVLKVAKGRLDELPLVIIGAQEDWRNTLMGAEFGYSVTEHSTWADSYLTAANQPSATNASDETLEAVVYQDNWIKCPNCSFRFCLNNLGSWSGQRHRRCGQRLKIIAT